MPDNNVFLNRVIAARRAAWFVVLIAIGLLMVTYCGFLGLQQGWADGLIEAGVYGETTRAELRKVTFLYAAALKLISTVVLLGALFLTFWVRGLRRLAVS